MDTEKSEKKLEETVNSGGWSVLRNKTFVFLSVFNHIYQFYESNVYVSLKAGTWINHLNQPALLESPDDGYRDSSSPIYAVWWRTI